MKRIAHMENDMSEKFGIPRQSGMVTEIISTIIFEPEYRNPDALRGLDEFSHLWIIWEFEGFGVPLTAESNSDDSEEDSDTCLKWSPTVRPPRLGGNTRMGVFATRSPNRPNPIGLSCVEIKEIVETGDGTVIRVAGADMRDGTAILDIKPYIPFTDSHPDATGGFVDSNPMHRLTVEDPDGLLEKALPPDKALAAKALIEQDPRPSYHNDPKRIYGMKYAGADIHFRIIGDTAVIV